jgi:predicted RNA-binding protein YlxR (DUF448 family)
MKIPERTCIACRAHSTKGELVRVVRGVDGEIRPDPSGKEPGRGAYICPKAECIAKALKEKRFDRALRAHIPPTLAGDLESALCVFGESNK